MGCVLGEGGDPQGGGYLGTKSIPTAKRPPRVEAVNVKNWGRSTPFLAKVGAVNYKPPPPITLKMGD